MCCITISLSPSLSLYLSIYLSTRTDTRIFYGLSLHFDLYKSLSLIHHWDEWFVLAFTLHYEGMPSLTLMHLIIHYNSQLPIYTLRLKLAIFYLCCAHSIHYAHFLMFLNRIIKAALLLSLSIKNTNIKYFYLYLLFSMVFHTYYLISVFHEMMREFPLCFLSIILLLLPG